MKFSFGIMQGRLTEPKGRGIQFFPFDNWENEFQLAADIGLDEIEFIFDLEDYEKNPLWSDTGINRINELIGQTGVKVNHICADYFMRCPFFRVQENIRKENVEILKRLIVAANQIGAYTIEIPLVDNSSIKTEDEREVLLMSLREVLPLAQEHGITLGLETDLPPKSFLELIERFNHLHLKANYDSGNSSGLGYNHYDEVITLNKFIHNIHIKDRLLGGTTVPLGSGSADFDLFFKGLAEVGYEGSFILQATREGDGEEAETNKKYIEFVKNYIQKYL